MTCFCYPLQKEDNRFILLASLLITPSPFAQFEFSFFSLKDNIQAYLPMKFFLGDCICCSIKRMQSTDIPGRHVCLHGIRCYTPGDVVS
jgi:hypothetical protein